MQNPVDERCFALAKSYLGGLKGVLPEDIQECAEHIQASCESFVRALSENDSDGEDM